MIGRKVYVFVEPDKDNLPVTRVLSEETALRWSREAASAYGKSDYRTDAAALDDFVVVHWASVVEVE